MNGDTQTQKYLNIAANGTREDLPTDTCCTTKTQKYILDVAERLFNNEEEIAEKQDKLTAGDNITIDPETNVISATGGGSSMPLYTTLGENTDGAITQKASREMIWATPARETVFIGTAAQGAAITSSGAIVIGRNIRNASMMGNVTIGGSSQTVWNDDVAVGSNANAGSHHCTAVGGYSQATGLYSTAVGKSARAARNGSTALGAYAVTTRQGEVNVGTGSENYGYDNTNTRVIGGVHAGVQDTDAVNVAQLNAAVGDIEAALTTLNSGTGV